MIPSIIQLREDVKTLKNQINRIERFILANDPECEACKTVHVDILIQLQQEHGILNNDHHDDSVK